MVFYGTPPGDITDPSMLEAEVENFVSSYLQFLISSGSLGPYPIVPGPVPPVMVQGRQVFSIILIMLFAGEVKSFNHVVIPTRGNRFHTNSSQHEHDELDSCVHLLCVFYQ